MSAGGTSVAQNRTLQRLITQLSHEDPNKRRQAIVMLGKTKSRDALPSLAEVFRSDPVPELRELARKAGVFIKQNADSVVDDPEPVAPAAAAGATAAAVAVTDDEDASASATPVVVTDEDRARARLIMQEVLNLSDAGENARAIKGLRNALKINPMLADDGYFTSLAGDVLGVDSSEAVAVLGDQQQAHEIVKSAKKQKRERKRSAHMEVVEKFNWGVVAFDLVAFFLIWAIAPVLFLLIFAQSVEQLLTLIGSGGAVEMTPELRELTGAGVIGGESFNWIILTVMGLSSGVSNTVGLMLYYGVLHVIARLLRGAGTYSFLVYKMTPMFNRYLIISYFLMSVGVALAIGQGFLPILACFSLIILLYTLYVGAMVAQRVGEAYNFGFAMGFVTVLLATLVLFAVQFGLAFLLAGAASDFLLQFGNFA